MKVIYTLLFLILTTSNPLKAKDSLSLYIFLLDDCPICIQYTPTINELYNQYGDHIAFVGYFPNFSSKPEKINKFKSTYNVEFPLYTDYFKKQAKKFNAQVTPEVILFNNSKSETIYQGRIDNMFYKLGRRRKVVTSDDLKLAIIQTLNNENIQTAYVEPVGCFINYSDNFNNNTKIDK